MSENEWEKVKKKNVDHLQHVYSSYEQASSLKYNYEHESSLCNVWSIIPFLYIKNAERVESRVLLLSFLKCATWL